MSLGLLLAYLATAGFIAFYIYKNAKAEDYLLYVVYLLPFMDLKILPFDYGNLKVFDGITLIAVSLHVKPFLRNVSLRNTRLFFVLIFFGVLLLSGIASDFKSRALLSLFSVLTPFIYAVMLSTTLRNNIGFSVRMIEGLKVALYVAILFILIQLVTGPQFSFYESLNQNVLDENRVRYPGYFMDAQINGIFLAMISFFMLFNLQKGKIGISNLVLFTVTLGMILLSGSRSPLFGIAGALGFLLVFLRGNARFQIIRYSLLCCALVLFASYTTDTFKRFERIDESIDFRINIWEGAFDIFREHPTLGIGMNNYKDYVIKYAQDQSLLLDNNEILFLDHPENGYLKLMVEWGIIATVILIGIILSPLITLAGAFNKGRNVKEAVVFAAVIVCWLISNLSVYTLADTRIIILLCTAIVLTYFFTTEHKLDAP